MSDWGSMAIGGGSGLADRRVRHDSSSQQHICGARLLFRKTYSKLKFPNALHPPFGEVFFFAKLHATLCSTPFSKRRHLDHFLLQSSSAKINCNRFIGSIKTGFRLDVPFPQQIWSGLSPDPGPFDWMHIICMQDLLRATSRIGAVLGWSYRTIRR